MKKTSIGMIDFAQIRQLRPSIFPEKAKEGELQKQQEETDGYVIFKNGDEMYLTKEQYKEFEQILEAKENLLKGFEDVLVKCTEIMNQMPSINSMIAQANTNAATFATAQAAFTPPEPSEEMKNLFEYRHEKMQTPFNPEIVEKFIREGSLDQIRIAVFYEAFIHEVAEKIAKRPLEDCHELRMDFLDSNAVFLELYSQFVRDHIANDTKKAQDESEKAETDTGKTKKKPKSK
jgi:hypothetical protein